MKNKQYVLLSLSLVLFGYMNSWAMHTPSNSSEDDEPIVFHSYIDTNNEKSQTINATKENDESEGSSSISYNPLNYLYSLNNNNEQNKDEQDNNEIGYFAGFTRKFYKSYSPEMQKQMIGALRNELKELTKTNNLLQAIKEKNQQPISAEEIKQLQERTSLATYYALYYYNQLISTQINKNDKNTDLELGEILKTLSEANNLIRFDRKHRLLLAPATKNILNPIRKEKKNELKNLITKNKSVLDLLDESLRNAAEDSESEDEN